MIMGPTIIQTQEELDQLEAVDYLREAQAGEPSFCREFSLCDAPGNPHE